LIFLIACGDDDSFFNESGPSAICTDIITSEDTQTAFKVELNGEEWVDSIINARQSDEILILEAISKKVDDEITRLRVEIRDPEFGVNNFDLVTSNQLIYETLKDDVLIINIATCGYINLTEIDQANNTVSGTFQADINGRIVDPTDIDITNGVFNDLSLNPVFCRPDFEEEEIDIDIFNTFKLIGIFELNDEIVSFPPCNLSSTISFAKRDLNGFERIDITGETVLNDFQASVFNLDESSFTTDDFTLTSQLGLPHELTFEAQFVQLIANANVTYTLEGNILTITNSLLGRKLTLVLLE